MTIPGIGDPRLLCEIMRARGMIRYPSVESCEQQMKIAESQRNKLMPGYAKRLANLRNGTKSKHKGNGQ